MVYDLSQASDRALRHVDVSFQSNCPAGAFAEALRTGQVTPTTQAALTLFLEEGSEQMILDLVTDGSSSFDALSRLSEDLLPKDHPTAVFLKTPPQ